MKLYINDYKLNLYDYHDYDSFDTFKSELGKVFGFLRNCSSKKELLGYIEKNKDMYTNIDIKTAELISRLRNYDVDFEEPDITDRRGGINMLNAIEEIRQDALYEGRNEGIREGITEGETRKLITQICRKLTKGMQCYDIADMLEEDADVVERICDIAINYAPNYDLDKIYEEYSKVK